MRELVTYDRVSSKAQTKAGKGGMDRQVTLAQAYAAKVGKPIVDSLDDAGISGYKKAKNNASHGKLAGLLDDLRTGRRDGKKMTLLCESVDRLSRQEPMEAFNLFGDIIRAGVEIVTLSDNRSYTSESIKDNAGDLYYLIACFQRAHEESSMKSFRNKKTWEQLREKIKDGTGIVGSKPAWFHVEDGEIKIRKKNKALVKRIVREYMAGHGQRAVCKKLNKEGIPSFTGGKWTITSVRDMLISKSLIGVYETPMIEAIDGYFPKILTDAEWNVLQAKMNERKLNVRATNQGRNINMFKGLIKCGVCGFAMFQKQSGGKDNKVKSLTCMQRLHHEPCGNGGYNLEQFYDHFFKWIRDIDFSAIFDDQSQIRIEADNLESLEGELLQINKGIRNLTKAIEIADDVEELVKRIKSLKVQQKEVELKIDEQKGFLDNLRGIHKTTQLKVDWRELDGEQKLKVHSQLKRVIGRIELFAKKHTRNHKGFKVTWTNGKQDEWRYFSGDSVIMDAKSGAKFTDLLFKVYEDGSIERLPFEEIAKLRGELTLDQIRQACTKHGISKEDTDRIIEGLN